MKKTCVLLLCLFLFCGCRKKAPVEVRFSEETAAAASLTDFASVEKTGYFLGNLYEQPDETSKVLLTAQERMLVVIIGENEQWYRCVWDGGIGYVKVQDVEIGLTAESKRSGSGSGGLGGFSNEEEEGDAPDFSLPEETTGEIATPPSSLIMTTKETTTENVNSSAANLLLGINTGRSSLGLPSLSLDGGLNQMAAGHAAQMAAADKVFALGKVDYNQQITGQFLRVGSELDLGKRLVKSKKILHSAKGIGIGVASGGKGVYYCIILE